MEKLDLTVTCSYTYGCAYLNVYQYSEEGSVDVECLYYNGYNTCYGIDVFCYGENSTCRGNVYDSYSCGTSYLYCVNSANCESDSYGCFQTSLVVAPTPGEIVCDGYAECQYAAYNCTDNVNGCLIKCTGSYSCQYMQFSCDTDKRCAVICTGYNACRYAKINCNSNEQCVISSAGSTQNYAMYGADITCAGKGNCLVNCNYYYHCMF